MVYITCSDRPFKLETDNDVSSLFAFFGQVRDRLLYLLSDVRERIAHQKSVSILSAHLPNISF
jgi:hypothetical protein